LKCCKEKQWPDLRGTGNWLIATKPANATVDLSRQAVVEAVELAPPINADVAMTVILERLRGGEVARSS
jgi:hypothetical protein